MVEVRSRSERRSENKQSFVFIAFIATVAIVCFASGFMVGRNTASKATVQMAEQGDAGMPNGNKSGDEKGDAAKTGTENLTFYEALPKGDQPPLGSGINLPPQEKIDEKVEVVAPQPDESKKPIPEKVFAEIKVKQEVVQTAVKPTPAPQPAKPKADTATTRYLLQVASYPQPDEAGKLLGRLTQGGYDVYVQQADLGSKGVWYRVFVGPITGKSKAVALQSRIEKEIKVKSLLRKK